MRGSGVQVPPSAPARTWAAAILASGLHRSAADNRGLRGPPVWRVCNLTRSAPNYANRPIHWDSQVAPINHAREVLRERRISRQEKPFELWLRANPGHFATDTSGAAGIRRCRREHPAVQRMWREAPSYRGIADWFASHAHLRVIGRGTVLARSTTNPTSDVHVWGTSIIRRDIELVALLLLIRASNGTLSFSVSRQHLPG